MKHQEINLDNYLTAEDISKETGYSLSTIRIKLSKVITHVSLPKGKLYCPKSYNKFLQSKLRVVR